MNPEHPFNVIFDHERHPHIAMASWDMKTFVQVHRAGQKDVWKSMKRVLGKDYKKSAESAMKGLTKLLVEYDAIDDREEALKDQLSTKKERGKVARIKILEKELATLAEEREELIEDEEALRDLGFKKIKEREELLGENA
jgi:predicted  nucleic acid-binding Zn-ribbon protein